MYTLEIKDGFGDSVLYYENITSSSEVQVINNEDADQNLIPESNRTAKSLIEWIKETRPNWTIVENGVYILGEKKVQEKIHGPKF